MPQAEVVEIDEEDEQSDISSASVRFETMPLPDGPVSPVELEFGKGEGDSMEEVEYDKAKADDLFEDSASANEEDMD